VIGAEVIWVGLPDLLIVHDLETRLRVVDVIRASTPDLVFTHSPEDYHYDHRLTFELLFAAAPLAKTTQIKTSHAPCSSSFPIFLKDHLGAKGFEPTHFVEITEMMPDKEKALCCHESQIRRFREQFETDFLEALLRIPGRLRGMQAGVPYAEGFRLLDAYGRTPAGNFLP
jgi:LmbE family N-acetylglucosaminyl deacetylase